MPPHPTSAHPAGEPVPTTLVIEFCCQDADTVVLTPTGEADAFTVPSLRQALARAVETGRRRIVVDVDRLSFVDASAINALVEASLSVKASGGDLRVRCEHHFSRRLLTLLGLERVLER